MKRVEEARTAVAEAERKAKEAGQFAADAEAARAVAVVTAADLERKVAAGAATQEDLDRARRRATEAAAEATQAKERADRARAWTDDLARRVTAANDRLTKAERSWRDAEGPGLQAQGPEGHDALGPRLLGAQYRAPHGPQREAKAIGEGRARSGEGGQPRDDSAGIDASPRPSRS